MCIVFIENAQTKQCIQKNLFKMHQAWHSQKDNRITVYYADTSAVYSTI